MIRLLLLVLIGIATILNNDIPTQKIVFLDVGQGDSIMFQDSNMQVLVDGGPGMKVLSELGKQMPYFDRTIEVVILSHPQSDHMEGLIHVLDRYNVGFILIPKISAPTLMQEKWLERIIKLNIPYRFSSAGQKLTVGDMQFSFLGPLDSTEAKAATKANINNGSVITRVDYCPAEESCMSLMLAGDAEKRAENILVSNTKSELLKADLLKVSHHGSNSSTHEQLLRAVSPRAAVISVGADNKFGHPRKEVLDRLGDIPLWRTDEQGAIQFAFVNKEWLVQ